MMKMSKRIFPTEEDFYNKFMEYIDYCKREEYLPNVAGFCAYVKMDRETWYNMGKLYIGTFKLAQQILEDKAINAKIGDSFRIFYMKNKFDYRDRSEVETKNLNYEAKTYEDFIKKTNGEEY